jgi:hypothetical protein
MSQLFAITNTKTSVREMVVILTSADEIDAFWSKDESKTYTDQEHACKGKCDIQDHFKNTR